MFLLFLKRASLLAKVRGDVSEDKLLNFLVGDVSEGFRFDPFGEVISQDKDETLSS